jgi:hypothetical protein
MAASVVWLLLAVAGQAMADGATPLLFIVERNTNLNFLRYEAVLDADGQLSRKEPVIAYWVMRAEKGQREEMNLVERKLAFGFDVKARPDGSVTMRLVAAKDRPIHVFKAGESIRAEMVIDGRNSLLERIYVTAHGGWRGYVVESVEFFGKDVQTGAPRSDITRPK